LVAGADERRIANGKMVDCANVHDGRRTGRFRPLRKFTLTSHVYVFRTVLDGGTGINRKMVLMK